MFAKGLAIGKTIGYRLRPLIDHFGARPLAEIRTADVEDFIADLRKPKIAGRRKKPRTLSPASINRTIDIRRRMRNRVVAAVPGEGAVQARQANVFGSCERILNTLANPGG